MNCDLRIYSINSIFAQPEANLNITPNFDYIQRLVDLVDEGIYKQMIYTNKNIKDDEDLRISLVNVCL